jgi:hypothetical protein
VSLQGFIPESYLVSGAVTAATFSGFITFIQTAASHKLQFTLTNSLPAKNSQYDSRLIVMCPDQMTADPGVLPQVRSMDGKLLKAAIAYETTFPGCTAPRVCYEITHSNLKDVPRGSTLSLTLTGTQNQDSVRDAGKFYL